MVDQKPQKSSNKEQKNTKESKVKAKVNTKQKTDSEYIKNKAVAESAYGNVFPVAKGGSNYNTATRLKRNNATQSKANTKHKRINGVLKPRGYKLLEEIGAGNYANVYSAVNKKDKIIAVKVIDLNKASNNYRLKFLPREIKVMSRVRHRNIVSIYEILQSANNIYILMEFAPNGTVSDYLRKNGPIAESRCKPMFRCVVDAIHYMHSLAISHRDIKVENIILDHKMAPKLTDFSYSKGEEVTNGKNRDLSRTFCGSLPYLSPEILQQKSYDPLVSDIWSLGIVLYIMLCDSLPFSFKNLNQMLDNQLHRRWKFHPKVDSNISDLAKDITRLMLEPDVKKRKTSTALLLHSWFTH